MKIIASLFLLLILAIPAPGQRISALPEITSIPTNNLFIVADPGVQSYKATLNTVAQSIYTIISDSIAAGASIDMGTNGTVFSLATTQALFYALNNLQIFATNASGKVSVGFGAKSNLSFYANGNEFVIGSWGGVFGISNATTARMSLYNNDSADDAWLTPGLITANSLKVIDLGGLGDHLAIGGDGTLYRTNGTGGGGSAGTNIAVGKTLYLDAAFGNDATASRTNALRPFLTVSNAIAAMLSGDTLVVRAGTYLINPKADNAGAPLGNTSGGAALTNKNNIRITGEPGAIWQMASFWSSNGIYSCPMLNLVSCTNVIIEGLTMIGIRTNAAQVAQHYAIMTKFCDGVTIRYCLIKNWQNQGVTDISQVAINRRFNVYNNEFRDIGGTNFPVLINDGTAWSAIVDDLSFVNNRFYHNLRNIELCCNADVSGLLYEGNISYGCYERDISLGGNVSNVRVENNISVGYATNDAGAVWMEIWQGSNIVVQANTASGISGGGIYYNQASAVRALVDLQVLDNTFTDISNTVVDVRNSTAMGFKVERISAMRNKFKNAPFQAITMIANNSRVENNEMVDCNTFPTVGGVIRVGYFDGLYTNTTNMTIIGNKIYTSAFTASSSTGIVVYGLSYSNVVWGNEVSRNYAGVIHDLGVGTLTMPLNKITAGRVLYSDDNSRMAASTMTVSSAGAVGIGDLSVVNFYANTFTLTNAMGSNVVRMGYQDLTNVLRRQTIYADAGSMISNSTDGATFSTEETSSPTNRMFDSYVFSGAVTNLVQFKFAMPINWDLSTVKVKLWTTSTNNIATTTNVWAISASAIKHTSVITNINWGTELTITNAVSSTGGQALVTPATPALTIGNTPAAAGNLVWFRIRRLPGHVGDNDGGAQKLLGAWIQYGETMSEVASW